MQTPQSCAPWSPRFPSARERVWHSSLPVTERAARHSQSGRGVIIVFAKHPEAGQVKTRLCPPFTPQQAAAFYEALLRDVLESTARDGQVLGFSLRLALHPPAAVEEWAARAPAFAVLPQRGANLAARMEDAAARAFADGCAPVLLRGSDSPALPPGTVRAARNALRNAELVICPDRDGGYNLAGLARPAPGLFNHPMSTRQTLQHTMQRAAKRGLRCTRLPAGFDIDTAEDLQLLRRARDAGRAADCPRTLAWLDAQQRWPAAD